MYKRRYTPEMISELKENEIFVFGSNLAGKHGGGAARVAYDKFGAVWGKGTGIQGQSYAIPTMQGGIKTIKPYVDEFIGFAKENSGLIFYVTKIGCGIAGFRIEEIAPLFAEAIDVDNIILPEEFVETLKELKRTTPNRDSSWDSYRFRLEYCRHMIEMKKGNSDAYYNVKTMRAKEFRHTVEIVNQGYYFTENGRKNTFPDDSKMQRSTVFYDSEIRLPDIPENDTPTIVDVENIDTIYAGAMLKEMGHNPALLNMASRRNPGGGVATGAGAQEETLFRRTNLFRSLFRYTPDAWRYGLECSDKQYPLDRNYGGIYTPDAICFRETERKGYALLESPVSLSFISVAGMNCPDLTDNGMIAPHHVEPIKNKIRTIFRIGLLHGHDSLVLGALGCGAFRNPPAHIARLFHEVMKEKEFKNRYKIIIFAILEDHNSRKEHNPEGNFFPFCREFHEMMPEMKKAKYAHKMRLMSLGKSAKRFDTEESAPVKKRIATKESWTTKPMPEEHITIPMDVVIPAKAMEFVKQGHIPDAMEDHWFMYCDEEKIRYFRSWTGICIFEARYRIDGKFCEITELKVNRNGNEYGETDEDSDIALFMGLLTDEYGGDSSRYWDKAL